MILVLWALNFDAIFLLINNLFEPFNFLHSSFFYNFSVTFLRLLCSCKEWMLCHRKNAFNAFLFRSENVEGVPLRAISISERMENACKIGTLGICTTLMNSTFYISIWLYRIVQAAFLRSFPHKWMSLAFFVFSISRIVFCFKTIQCMRRNGNCCKSSLLCDLHPQF